MTKATAPDAATPAIPAALQRALPTGRTERALVFDRAMVDVEARTAALAFASETPFERYWGIEVLDCTTPAMRLGRLTGGANLLCDHDSRDVVGVIESVEIGADRIARAVVRFGKSARAQEVFQDVVDGIRRNVSVGYMIHKAILVETKDNTDTYRVTDWEPFEVSLVSVPADASVGVGRSAEFSTPEPAALAEPVTPSIQKKDLIMTTEKIEVVATRNHPAEISAIAAGIPGGAELAMRAIQEGKTVEEFQQIAIKALSNKPLPTADIGMSRTETQRYSMLRAINAMANPSDRAAQAAAAFEFECSGAMTQKMGRAAQGFYVPYDVLSMARRDLTKGTAISAGNLVDTTLDSGNFIDMLRANMVMGGLGVQYLSGLVGDIDIPRQYGTATTYWLAEQAAPTKSNQTVDKVNLNPKTVGAKTILSRKLRNQASMDVEAWVQRDLAMALSLEMERVIINGSGASNQPLGIMNVAGIGSVVGGANGLAPTWDHIVNLETAVSVMNADVGSLAYLTNAVVRGKLKRTFVASGTAERVWDKGTEPLNGYRAAVTNLVPSNLTKGTSTGVCSAILYGNFRDVIIGMWGGLDILVDPYTGGDAGDVSVRVLQDIDVAVRHAESLAVMKDALTA